MIGQVISHYRILEKLGEGGMGVVYKAEDLKLDRPVALKFLPAHFGADEEHKKRFIHEAKAASALDHPNICTIYEIGESDDGQMFIAMAYYQGETLKSKIERGPLPVAEAVDLAQQMAQGLAKAHAQGLVHRDVKPANVIVTTDGVAKIVDFGLAKVAGGTELTKTGTTLGTAGYMSPEQAQGDHVDARTDAWALGVVLYEMLAGQRPFRGEHLPGIVYAIVNQKPKPLRELRPDLPVELERIVERALEKNPRSRYPSAAEPLRDLTAFRASLSAPQPVGLDRLVRSMRRPQFAVVAVLLLLLLGGIAGWWWRRAARVRWAKEQALPEIVALIDKGSYVAAYNTARQAEQQIPKDPALAKLWPEMSRRISIQTTPPGADIYMKEYAAVNGAWEHLGQSPLNDARIPLGFFRWKATKQGFETAEGAGPIGLAPDSISFALAQQGAAPAGMVRVPQGTFRATLAGFGGLGPMPIGEYWIDKYEVTNQQFKEFVARGGYQKPEYWKHPFVKDRRSLSWEQAMAEFRDTTGRPGPSSWEAGVYPDGKDDFPVNGVSWYEAAAYAEFAGKHLPTLYHWYHAAQVATAPSMVPFCNFGTAGPARVGSYPGVGPYGTYDMAGNVKEWCSTPSGDQRFIVGGAWNENSYMFHWPEPRSPFDRSAGNGFRCVKYSQPGGPPPEMAGPLRRLFRDYTKEKPVSDEVFRIFRSMYSYEPGPLDAVIESTDASPEYWTKQKVSYNAGYGKERVPAYLFLPKNAKPPFQTVIFFPGSNVLFQQSSATLGGMPQLDFLIKNGRALLYPIYKGTYERQIGLAVQQQNREVVSQWVKDLGHSIDYLESRPDIDRNKIGYCGTSMGARVGMILAALEPRIKAYVAFDGGLSFVTRASEADEVNFAPRVKIPVLMLSGRYDFIFPLETSQNPLFRLLGTPEKDKKHVVLESAHNVLSMRSESVRQALDWLDRYLGPAR